MALTLHFLRHGETASSRTGNFCGALNIDLSPAGLMMAEDFSTRYQEHSWAGIYVSPLVRTRATAEPLCRKTGLAMQLRAGLREIEYGAWEGRSASEVGRDFNEDYLLWLADPGWNSPTGGERGVDVALRAMAVIEEIRQQHDDGDVLVVSHKATIRILLCQFMGIDLGRYRDRLDAPVGSLSSVEFRRNGPILKRLGDRTHLRPELLLLPGT